MEGCCRRAESLFIFDDRSHLFNIINIASSLFIISFLSDVEEISKFHISVDVRRTILLLILLLGFLVVHGIENSYTF